MKKLLAVIFAIFISIQVYAQKPVEEKEIQATVVRFFDALTALNDATIRAEVTSDFTLVEHGLIWNQDSLITAIQPMKGGGIKRTNSFKFIKTEQKGDVAWVVYYNTADLAMGDKTKTIKWLESVVVIKQAGKWKIQLLHNTELK